MTAYILIQANPHVDGSQLAQEVAQLPGIDRTEFVSGPFDVIAEAGEDLSLLTDIIIPRIARLSGVLRAIASPIQRPFLLANQEAAS